jgi:hypothetical protein
MGSIAQGVRESKRPKHRRTSNLESKHSISVLTRMVTLNMLSHPRIASHHRPVSVSNHPGHGRGSSVAFDEMATGRLRLR